MNIKFKDLVGEKEVEHFWWNALKEFFPNCEITARETGKKTDGILIDKENKIFSLIEVKEDLDLKKSYDRAKILIQSVFYLKKYEIEGKKLPKTVFVGDKNEAFVVHTNGLLKYLDYDVDWKSAPSQAYKKYPNMLIDISEDDSINPFVFDIKEGFNFVAIKNKLIDQNQNVKRLIKINDQNLHQVFNYFCKNVLIKSKMSVNQEVNLFIDLFINPSENYLHPKKKNTLHSKSIGYVKVNEKNFMSFFEHFDGEQYTVKEKEKMVSIIDRLIQDETRKRQGEFFTPTIWVDEAHRMISEQFGEDWKEKYVVWDCCYDGETEFLSQYGWKKIRDFKDGDLVMQYNSNGTSTFVKPLKYIKQEYYGEWYIFNNANTQIKTTADHDYVLINNKNKKLFKEKAINIYNEFYRIKDTHWTIPLIFDYNGDLNIDENILRLFVAINADGTYRPNSTLNGHKNRTKSNTKFTNLDTSDRNVYSIRIKKQRKIDRCRLLLENNNINYQENFDGEYHDFIFKFPYQAKLFPNEWYNLDKKSKEIILDEILYWDGSIIKQNNHGRISYRKIYNTSKKEDFDFIQFCAHSIGLTTHTSKRKNNYTLAFKDKIKTAKISNKNNTFTKEKSNGDFCYCFTVKSGMLVMRKKDKIFISGNCWGTGNLTRDYKFKELYCSTLHESDINTANQMKINMDATKFEFDFLNDDLESLKHLAPGLWDAIQNGREILFLINPPYGTSSNMNFDKNDTKTGIAKTKINIEMLDKKLGKSSSQLYTQFLYRISKIKNTKICLFSPPLFLSGDSYKKFRKLFLNNYKFLSGMLFDASNFADVKSWGLSFSIWDNTLNDNDNFLFGVKNLDDNLNIINSFNKIIYNTDKEKSLSKWIRDEIKNDKNTILLPHLSSALTVSNKDNQKLINNCLGSICILSNSVYKNNVGVSILSSIQTQGNANISLSIIPENFNKVCVTFTARKSIKSNWINQKDEYIAPTEEVLNSDEYKQWNNDAIVYSLFNTSSNQSSMRQVEYKDKLWDIKNEFFWLSREKMMNLAEQYYFDEIYQDARNSDERYVYKLLQETKLSPDAKELIELSEELIEKSFKMRKFLNEEHPEWHLHTWDAGWYQIKLILKEYFKDDYKIFTEKYKKFEDRMRPYVYKFGFLK